MDNQFLLRGAQSADIDALSQLYQQTFRETFVEDFSIPYPEKDLISYFRSSSSPESFTEALNNPKAATWVIEDKTNGQLGCFCSNWFM